MLNLASSPPISSTSSSFYDLHHQLAWADGIDYLLPIALSLILSVNSLGFIVHVGIDQSAAYIFYRIGNIQVVDAGFALQVLKRRFEAFRKIIKNIADDYFSFSGCKYS